VNAQQIAALTAALIAANGKRRERTASLADVERVVSDAARGIPGMGVRATFGCVSNSYNSRAVATQVTAARVGDVVRVRITCGNAARKSGGGPDYVVSEWNRDVTALLADAAPAGTIEIPVRSAKRGVGRA